MKRIPLLLACCLAIPFYAQTQDADAPSFRDPTYNLVLRFYTWPLKGVLHDGMEVPSIPLSYLYSPLQGYKEVVLSRGTLSPPIRYVSPKAPELLTRVANGTDPETGERLWKTSALVSPEIPDTWKESVVVIFPDSQRSDGTYRSLALEAGDLKLPRGGSRFLNTSRKRLVMEVDGKRKAIDPGASVNVNSSGGSGDRMRVRLYSKDQQSGKVELIYTASHWRREATGNLYIIYPASANRLKVLQLSPEDFEEQPATVASPSR